MRRLLVFFAFAAGSALLLAACGQAAPAPAPTNAPAQSTKASAPAALSPAAPVAAVAPTAAPAKKVDFPAQGKAITMLVPFAAGGGTDIAARLIAPIAEKDLGGKIVVENKPGAATQIAATELANAKPDGYTIGIVGFAAILISYLDPDRQARYTRDSFAPIAHFGVNDNLIAVKSDSPYKNITDLVNAAKKGSVKLGTSGQMSNTHLAAMMLEEAAGVNFSYVHFEGGAPSIVALLGGHVDGVTLASGDIMNHYRSGAIRVLGTMGRQQSRLFPEVKTYEAQGYKTYSVYSFGFAAPAGTPKEIIDLQSQSFKRAMQNSDMVNKLLEMGMEIDYKDPAQFAAFWADYEQRVKPLLEKAKARQKS